MMGQPSMLTPTRHQAIVDLLNRGAYAEMAAEATGISKRTYHAWRQRGTDALHDHDNPPLRPDYVTVKAWRDACNTWAARLKREARYVHFLQATTRACAFAEARAVECLMDTIDNAARAVVVGNGPQAYVEMVPDYDLRLKAAVEFLKRRHGNRWSERRILEHAGEMAVQTSSKPLDPAVTAAADLLLMSDEVPA